VAEVPHFSECPHRCELHFRDVGFAPATHFEIAPNAGLAPLARNPEMLAFQKKRYEDTKKNWKEIMKIPATRTHDDSPFMMAKHSDKHQNGAYGGTGRRRCYGGPSYRKVSIAAMTFDVVTPEEKHMYFMDTCGRVISTVVVGPLGKERVIEQTELAGIKCRERMLHGGQSFDGKGSNAAFAPFYGRFYSGTGLVIMTDRTTLLKYMVVADGWKSRIRMLKLQKVTSPDLKFEPPEEERLLGSTNEAQKAGDCVKEGGACADASGKEVTAGVTKLFQNDVITLTSQKACLEACFARPGTTGCQGVSGKNKGCYAHTGAVAKGDGKSGKLCWVFSKCKDAEAPREYTHPWVTPRPDVKHAIVTSPDPFPAPRKLSAGESENMYVVSQFAMIFDVDLRPVLKCSEAEKVFALIMRDNPSNWYKHHFGFDKWLPDKEDATQKVCETTDECRGNTVKFEPVCKCPDAVKIATGTICARTHLWDTCSKKACKALGKGCNPSGVRGTEKKAWADAWFKQLNNEARVNYHGGWMHFPIQKLQRTLRYCLERKLAKDTDGIDMVDENTPPEKLHKEGEKKAAEFKQRQKAIGEDCGVKFGSWWQIELMKQVQLIRHMCGPKGAPGEGCHEVYLVKYVLCSQQVMGSHHNIAALKETREPLPPMCCTNKAIMKFITPRLGNKGGNPVQQSLGLPTELHEEVLGKLKMF